MPFRPLLVSWTGRGDAAQLTAAEPHGDALPLPSRQVLSGFYLNELIISLTTRHDPQPQLFEDYGAALRSLSGGSTAEPTLRVFEKRLLASLGYGLEFSVEAGTYYRFHVGEGLAEVREDAPGAYSGRCLLALQQEDLRMWNRSTSRAVCCARRSITVSKAASSVRAPWRVRWCGEGIHEFS